MCVIDRRRSAFRVIRYAILCGDAALPLCSRVYSRACLTHKVVQALKNTAHHIVCEHQRYFIAVARKSTHTHTSLSNVADFERYN